MDRDGVRNSHWHVELNSPGTLFGERVVVVIDEFDRRGESFAKNGTRRAR